MGHTTLKTRLPEEEKQSKYHAMTLLLEQGVKIPDAAKMLGYSTAYAYKLARKAKEQNQKLSILSESRIRKAHRVVEKLMDGKTFGDIKEVKCSTALKAAETVIDRNEPKVQENQTPSLSWINFEINLNLVKPDHPDYLRNVVENPPIDVSDHAGRGNSEPKMVGLETPAE